ncbi:ATPase [Pyrobaculum islandicum DSM 4184]|uniref:ATPase n=1 Tax=Pyrobaculum islandicum (strain DSM 4184 / JCM 9189 / GEO3) TaxID=384616 RepID=A1RUH1_PYRIL|nr:ATP-binding protein [Pyrobaculum islandicum]ABL88603.1 ATPase [Pyrobaculum islandicum DSM 4184]
MVIFLDREEELERLREALRGEGFRLVVVYGRRRIGKTTLVLKATEDMRRVYYLAVGRGNLRRFKQAAARVDPGVLTTADDWEAVFTYLRDRVDVVIIDEFPNLIEEDKAILSTLQAVVDEVLVHSNLKLVLTGSSISTMTSKVLSYKSPLYGRRTASLRVDPIPFLKYKQFFPDRPPHELVEIHGFAGGIPYYMVKVKEPFWDFLERELRERTFLLDEGDFLLRYEFEDVSTYRQILEAIAAGKNTLGEIRDHAGLRSTDITPYLRNLEIVGIVRKVKPVLGRGRYRYELADGFLRFWLRFISPNLWLIEQGLYGVEDIRREYSQYLGKTFEEIAREVVVREIAAGRLPRVRKLGPQWWTRRGEAREIDLLGVGDGVVVAVEARWRDGVDAAEVAQELREKVEELGLPGRVVPVVVARSFKRREGAVAYDLGDIYRMMA